MTLQFSGLSKLIGSQFGVTEIASMLTVGKAVSTLITRKNEAAIFAPLCAQYDLRVKPLPKYLDSIQFDRCGTILGSRQRQVYCENVMPDVEIDTVEGIATFLVLILRYIETPPDIVNYIKTLLQGGYGIVTNGSANGGDFSLPYPVETVLRSFVNAVLDADAASGQHAKCRQWMSELAVLMGSTNAFASASEFVQEDHQRLLRELLSYREAKSGCSKTFHTFSGGSAMIALAALANGAHVSLECITESGTVAMPSSMPQRAYPRQRSFRIMLWLVDPPADVKAELSAISRTFGVSIGRPDTVILPIFGGMSEICTVVSRQLGCTNSFDETFSMWQAGVIEGQRATWESKRGKGEMFALAFSDGYLDNSVPGAVGPMADKYFRAPRNDRRHRLARKAASVFHGVLHYTDYDDYVEGQFQNSIALIIIALSLGALQSLVSNSSGGLPAFAWTLDCRRTLGLAEHLADFGLSPEQLIMQASQVWGGRAPKHSPYLDEKSHAVGMICPEIIIVLDVIQNPQRIAANGLKDGLMSLHRGSTPMLPREQTSGFILAGDPRSGPSVKISAPEGIEGLEMEDENDGSLIISAEPVVNFQGLPSICLCVWQHGDVVLELDPSVVQSNLLVQRSYQIMPDKNNDVCVTAIKRTELLSFRSGFNVIKGMAIIHAENRTDWQVAAAGCHLSPRTILLEDKEEVRMVERGDVPAMDGYVIILAN